MAAMRQDMDQGAAMPGSSSMTGIAAVHAELGDRTSSQENLEGLCPDTTGQFHQSRRPPVRDGSGRSGAPCSSTMPRQKSPLSRVPIRAGSVALGALA